MFLRSISGDEIIYDNFKSLNHFKDIQDIQTTS